MEVPADEPLTPAGRLFLRPEMDQVINSLIGLENPLDISGFKAELSSSLLVKHPRFSSLLVRDRRGFEHWRRTTIDVDRHVIVVNSIPNNSVNDYIADLCVSTPLPLDKPLWETHLLLDHNCIVFRIHHALGDGISLVSLLLSCCRKIDDAAALPSVEISAKSGSNNKKKRRAIWELVWEFVKVVWFTVVFVVGFVGRTLWVKDKNTVVSGGDGVELWPRKLATASFLLEDMKLVKKAVPNATINDVLFGVISSGLSKYLDIRSPDALPQGLQFTGIAMVNLRQQSGLPDLSALMNGDSGMRWGNKFGMMLLPVYYHKSDGEDPLQSLKRAKAMLDKKKKSLEAHFSYQIGDLAMSCLGAKFASMLNYRILCNTTFTISNVVGPQDKITVAGNPVTHLRVTSSGLPHVITMHMVSYAGKADMQILVAKDIIHDAQAFARCFEDALLEMKEAAVATLQL